MSTVLITDASPLGIEVLTQWEPSEECPIAFASCSLATAEKNCSQLDKEALIFVFGVAKFRQYLQGWHSKVQSKVLLSKGVKVGSAVVWVQLYPEVQAGFLNCPCSWVKLATPTNCPADIFRLGVWVLSPNAVTTATARDSVPSQVRAQVSMIQLNQGSHGRPYEAHFYWLSVRGNCVLRGNRVFVPTSLQGEVLHLLHESHPGGPKMKAGSHRLESS